MCDEYRGFKIYQCFRRVEKSNPISGHTWSEPEPISRYRIEAPEGFPPFLQPDDLRTEAGARKHIDYLIRTRDYQFLADEAEEVAEEELTAPAL